MKILLTTICIVIMLCSCVATGEQQVKADPQPEAAFTITKADIAKLIIETNKAAAAVNALPAYQEWLKALGKFNQKAKALVMQTDLGKEWAKQDKLLRSKWDRTPEFNLLQDLRAKAEMYKDLLKTTKE